MKFVAATILALATSASAFAPAPSASVSSFFQYLTFSWASKLLIDSKISNWNGMELMMIHTSVKMKTLLYAFDSFLFAPWINK